MFRDKNMKVVILHLSSFDLSFRFLLNELVHLLLTNLRMKLLTLLSSSEMATVSQFYEVLLSDNNMMWRQCRQPVETFVIYMHIYWNISLKP